jgi:hypothetical protein
LKYQAFALQHVSRHRLRDTVLGIFRPPLSVKDCPAQDLVAQNVLLAKNLPLFF